VGGSEGLAQAAERSLKLYAQPDSMASICRRLSQRSDGDDDPQPGVCALSIAPLAQRLNPLPRLRHGVVAEFRDQKMSGAIDVEIGNGHGVTIARPATPMKRADRPTSVVVNRRGA
jgi:hypothetical protein